MKGFIVRVEYEGGYRYLSQKIGDLRTTSASRWEAHIWGKRCKALKEAKYWTHASVLSCVDKMFSVFFQAPGDFSRLQKKTFSKQKKAEKWVARVLIKNPPGAKMVVRNNKTGSEIEISRRVIQ